VRGLTASEYAQLAFMAALHAPRVTTDADEEILCGLLEHGRVMIGLPHTEDADYGWYLSPLGHLALRLWPAIRAERT
jgi:hypothetical protein